MNIYVLMKTKAFQSLSLGSSFFTPSPDTSKIMGSWVITLHKSRSHSTQHSAGDNLDTILNHLTQLIMSSPSTINISLTITTTNQSLILNITYLIITPQTHPHTSVHRHANRHLLTYSLKKFRCSLGSEMNSYSSISYHSKLKFTASLIRLYRSLPMTCPDP